MKQDQLDLRPGGRFLDYVVEECLGEGGMGEVYAAVEKNSGIEVAIKSLRGCYLGREDFVLRLQQECKLYSKLRHPNIVRMYRSVFTQDGRVFIVMERIRGKTIRKLLQSARRLDFLNAIHVMLQVAEAIGASHEAGIWHRDLKPENVMIGTAGGIRGHVWVLDFGIATDQSFNTDELPRIGTGRYMAPEQVRNQKADGRGDIYAFGVMFYELLTGKHTFLIEGESVPLEQILIGHLHADPPRPVHEIVPDCPETLWPILERCLEKDPEERYATMDEVADDMRAILRASLPPNHPLARRILQEKLRVERRAAFDTLAPEAPEGVAFAKTEEDPTTATEGHRVTEPLLGFVPSTSVLPFSSPMGPLPAPRPPLRGKGFTEEIPRLAPIAAQAPGMVPPVQTTPLVHVKAVAPARASAPARTSAASHPSSAARSRSTLPLSYFLAPLAGLVLTLSGTIVVATIRSERSTVAPAVSSAEPPPEAGTSGEPVPSATATSEPAASSSVPVPDPIPALPSSIPAPPPATVVSAPPTAPAAPKPPPRKPASTSKPVAPAPKPSTPVPLFEFGSNTGSKSAPGKRK